MIPTKQDEMQMMGNPFAWPLPYLPVKSRTRKKDETSNWPLMGIMTPEDVTNSLYVVHEITLDKLLMNQYQERSKVIAACKKWEYPSLEALVDDGWVVD